ncbi:MAG: DNA repair protein RadC [Lachnospiraceae bacterium]|nr:DNA repair protein RadC [Lachnospiraceae bacterium]
MEKTVLWTTTVDPQTKAAQYGIGSLTDAELLALVIRNGTQSRNALEIASDVLAGGDGFYALMEADKADLLSIDGIGEARAYLLLAVQQIAIRAYGGRKQFKVPLQSAKDAADIVMQELRYEHREYVILMMLDVRMRLMERVTMFIGTAENAVCSTRELFSMALKKKASSVILVHNHPSGDPSPSDEDIEATKKAEEAGMLLDIPLLDHIIVGDFRFYSFRENGLISGPH